MHVKQRHVRVHILGVGLEQRALKGATRQSHRTLFAEEPDVLRRDLGREDRDEGRQQGARVHIFQAVELRCSIESNLVQEVRQEPPRIFVRSGASKVRLGD